MGWIAYKYPDGSVEAEFQNNPYGYKNREMAVANLIGVNWFEPQENAPAKSTTPVTNCPHCDQPKDCLPHCWQRRASVTEKELIPLKAEPESVSAAECGERRVCGNAAIHVFASPEDEARFVAACEAAQKPPPVTTAECIEVLKLCAAASQYGNLVDDPDNIQMRWEALEKLAVDRLAFLLGGAAGCQGKAYE